MTEESRARASRRARTTAGGAGDMRTESATAQAIMQAAVALFSEQGYATTSLRQIADAVGLQVGSLYNHIASKEQLLSSIMKRSMTRLIDDTDARVRAASDPVERVRAFVKAGIRFHAEHRQEALIGSSELRALSAAKRRGIVALRDRYQGRLERLLQDAVDAKLITVPDVKLAAYAGVAICVHVASWYRPDGRLALDELEDRLAAAYTPTVRLRAR